MDIIKQYRSRTAEIIGTRTPAEAQYDDVVVAWLQYSNSIKVAIEMANQKYPSEALILTADNITDVESHYEYLVNHAKIQDKLQKMGR